MARFRSAAGWVAAVLVIGCTYVFAQEQEGRDRSFFLISPMGGYTISDINYDSPPGSAHTLSDSGPLYAMNMLYLTPDFTVGSMGHYSKLDKSTENGYLFYGIYYFNRGQTVRPAVGFYADYINVFTHVTGSDVSPLASLNVNTSVWGLHPIAGVAFALGEQRIMPFLGYFNERVDTSVASEGMPIAGRNRNGFSADSTVVLDYMSVGIKAELEFLHFIRFDTKFYTRFKNGDEAQFTARNRLDFMLSRAIGISVKYDYFGDKYEKNSFTMAGPVFLF